jgi:hypothetical protein
MADAPFASAEDALRHAYHIVAKREGLGVKNTLGWDGGGEHSAAEHIAQAAMIINTMRDNVRDPFRAAICGAFQIAIDWQSRDEKYEQLEQLANWIESPNKAYKMHCLGVWSGLHQLNEDRWAERLGRTPRTLQRWRNGKDGVTERADQYLKVGLNITQDVFKECGLI